MTTSRIASALKNELRIKEQRYRELFNYTPVGLLEIDARKRTEMLDDLHREGVTDIEAYLNANPDFEKRAIDASVIKDVNPQTVEMLGARDAEELIGLSTARLLSMSAGGFRAGTVSRFRGDKPFPARNKGRDSGRSCHRCRLDSRETGREPKFSSPLTGHY